MNILITGAFKYSKEQIDTLKNAGYKITFIQNENEPLNINFSLFDVVVCNNLFSYNDIKKFTNLKMVQTLSAGLDRIPVAYIKEHNISLYNAEDTYSIPIAEWIILKTLEIYKNSKFFINNQKNQKWEKNRNIFELNSKTVSVIGTGNIGLEALKRFKAFNVSTIAVDIVEKKSPFIDKFYLINDLNKALSLSDIVVLTLPLTKETEKIINKNTFKYFKKNSLLINVSRGKIIEEKDLIEEIKANKFLGVALDVFETEPLPKTSPLWSFDNVSITPHNSFISENNNKRLFDVIYKNCHNFIKIFKNK